MRKYALLTAVAVMLSVLLGTLGLAQAKGEKAVKHPLQVMKATIEKEQVGAMQSCKGNCTIWLKNISQDTVTKVKVTLKLREGSREIRSLDKEVESIDAGKRIFLYYKWEDYSDRKLAPQIWVTYEGPEGPITFQGEPPVW